MRRAVFAALGAVVVALLLFISSLSDAIHDTDPSPAVQADKSTVTPAMPATAAVDPPSLNRDRRQLRRTSRKFVAAYYDRDASLLHGTLSDRTARYEARLRPYVSEQFLKETLPPLDTPPDEAVRTGNGKVSARVASFGSGHMDGADSAELDVTVELFVRYPQHAPLSRTFLSAIYLVRTDDGWVVEAHEEMYG